jgi:hypothetical protein
MGLREAFEGEPVLITVCRNETWILHDGSSIVLASIIILFPGIRESAVTSKHKKQARWPSHSQAKYQDPLKSQATIRTTVQSINQSITPMTG